MLTLITILQKEISPLLIRLFALSWFDALRIDVLSARPNCAFFPSHVVLGHHALIFVKEQMAMLHHVSCKLVYLEPDLHREAVPCGWPADVNATCFAFVAQCCGELQRIVPVSYLVPIGDNFLDSNW